MYKPNPETSCERVRQGFNRFVETGDVLWEGSRVAYSWLSANIPGTYSMLDIGCGAGFGTNMLLPRNVVGIDKNPQSIAFAQSVYSRMFFDTWDIALSPYPRLVDCVVMLEVVEHITDWVSAAENAKLCAAQTVVISTPNREYEGYPDDRPSNAQHTREFVVGELLPLFEDGWKIDQYDMVALGTEELKKLTYVRVKIGSAESASIMFIARRIA